MSLNHKIYVLEFDNKEYKGIDLKHQHKKGYSNLGGRWLNIINSSCEMRHSRCVHTLHAIKVRPPHSR